MIGYLKGRIVETGLENVVVDVNGVGYDVACSSNTLDELFEGVEARLWIHTHVREDAIALFGFSSPLEKRVFLSLLKANGVGPKMALKILSSSSLTGLLQMIEAGDVKALSGLPKVGKKTAEQIVLTLQGKMTLAGEGLAPGRSADARPLAIRRFAGARGDVASALLNLGFRPLDVEQAVDELPETVDVEQGVRQSLRRLSAEN